MGSPVRIGVVPFFGGTSSATNSQEDTREAYLLATLHGLRANGFQAIVGVQNKEDAIVAMRLTLDEEIVQAFPYEEPQWLPTALFRWVQEEAKGDVVYVTEADQILKAQNGIDPLLEVLDAVNYLVPHRFEEVGAKGQGKDRGPIRLEEGKTFVLPNTHLPDPIKSRYYWPYHPTINTSEAHLAMQFGGGFLCLREMFDRIQFPRSEELPVEWATGFAAAHTGFCLKTTDVRDFYVWHLSGLEYHNSLEEAA